MKMSQSGKPTPTCSNLLMAFLNIINLEPVQWPSGYQQKLLPLETYRPPRLMLNKELREMVQRFSSIQHLQLYNSQTDDMFRQFNSVLANSFGSGLRSLNAWKLYGVDLINFSENLACLSYACSTYLFPLLSKINTSPLKKLHFLSIPERPSCLSKSDRSLCGFQWSQYYA